MICSSNILRFIRQPTESGPLNWGNSREFSVLELARTVVELTGSRSRIVHAPLPRDDPKQRKPDLTRARAVLGFEARVHLREGLTKTIETFRSGSLSAGGAGLHVVNTRTGVGGITPESADVRVTGGRD